MWFNLYMWYAVEKYFEKAAEESELEMAEFPDLDTRHRQVWFENPADADCSKTP